MSNRNRVSLSTTRETSLQLPQFRFFWNSVQVVGAIACLAPVCLHGANPAFGAESGLTPRRPNIVVILADDMGYSDLGCTGAEIETPHLDSLARNGMLFTHFYNTSRCCPSRAALLTGQYQWDAGLGHMNTTRSRLPEYQQQLNTDTPTIAELLLRAGYQTVMSGKWHVGNQREFWPDRRGFQKFYGTPTGGGLYFYPSPFYDRPVFQDGVQVTPDHDWYSTDGFTDYAIDFLDKQSPNGAPFFMYLAYIAPHFPLQARPEDIEKYESTYTAGYQVIRDARFQKQKQLGIVPHGCRPSAPEFSSWSSVRNRKKAADKMAVYAAQVDRLDQNVGRLIHALKAAHVFDNTVVMFLSDNGGCSSGFDKTPNVEIGGRLSNASYGKWYNVSNTPYRKAKSQEHEGGIITPLIVHWPEGIGVPGSLKHQPAHIMDILPTCLDLAGLEYPDSQNGRVLDPIDGVSLLPILKSDVKPAERTLYWEHEGNRAVRSANWKLVALRGKDWELFDLKIDPFEETDVSQQKPKVVERLRELYETWANVHGVQSWPLPKLPSK